MCPGRQSQAVAEGTPLLTSQAPSLPSPGPCSCQHFLKAFVSFTGLYSFFPTTYTPGEAAHPKARLEDLPAPLKVFPTAGIWHFPALGRSETPLHDGVLLHRLRLEKARPWRVSTCARMRQQSTAPSAAGSTWIYPHPGVRSAQPGQASDQQPNGRENSSVLPQPSADSSESVKRAGVPEHPRRHISHPSRTVTGPQGFSGL